MGMALCTKAALVIPKLELADSVRKALGLLEFGADSVTATRSALTGREELTAAPGPNR